MEERHYEYNYRVYGYARGVGYTLIEKTKSFKKALSHTNRMEYDKILIIRHNIELNMDEPIVYVPLDIRKAKVRRR